MALCVSAFFFARFTEVNQAAVTAVDSSVNASATSIFNVGPGGPPFTQDGGTSTQNDSQGNTNNALNATASRGATGHFGSGLSSSASGSILWTSPSSGQVVFGNTYGSNVNSMDGSNGGSHGTSASATYRFLSTNGPGGSINIVYGVGASTAGSTFGVGPGAVVVGSDFLTANLNTSGTFSSNQVSGDGINVNTVGFIAAGYSVAGNLTGSNSGAFETTFLFAIDGLVPGCDPNNPLLPNNNNPGIFEFAVPIIDGGFGNQDFVFIDPEIATGYSYASDIPFTSVLVPNALPGGDDTFELQFGSTIAVLTAGVAFDFTSFVPGGVTQFQIVGIDPGEMLDPNDPLAFNTGLKYANAGLSHTTMTPFTVIPEPSSLLFWVVGTVIVAGFTSRKRRRRATR